MDKKDRKAEIDLTIGSFSMEFAGTGVTVKVDGFDGPGEALDFARAGLGQLGEWAETVGKARDEFKAIKLTQSTLRKVAP